MTDLPEFKENSASAMKSPAERVAETLNDMLNLISLPAMLGTHLAIAFSILLFEPDYQLSPTSPIVPSTVISSASLVSSLKPYIVLYNGAILLALFYCIVERHRPEPLQLTTALNLGAVWCDLLVAGSFKDVRVWIILSSILHRLFTSLILVRHWYERRRRLLMKKRQHQCSLEARIRSLEKQNSALRECRDMGCLAHFPTSKRGQVYNFYRPTPSSSTSKRSKSTSRSGAPSSSFSSSYYSVWNSFSGDPVKEQEMREEESESSPSKLSASSQANPINTGNQVSLDISLP